MMLASPPLAACMTQSEREGKEEREVEGEEEGPAGALWEMNLSL